MKSKNRTGSRKDLIEKYGYDVKFAYNVVRLLNEIEQILMEHDLDLQRNREQLKSIRRGEWTLEDIEKYFVDKEKSLEKLYIESSLRHKPNEVEIKELLLNCLEQHFGNLDSVVKIEGKHFLILQQIKDLVNNI